MKKKTSVHHRPSWDEYFLEMASLVAKRSTCLRQELKIPSGERHELCRALHAEQNALIQASLHGISVKDATLYTTTQPCVICAKMLINAGIKEIEMTQGYPDKMAMDFLKQAKVKLRKI